MFVEEFFLKGGLDSEQIDLMHEKALHLCETVGVVVPHQGILDRLSSYDGVAIEGNNVQFRSDLVTRALQQMKYVLPERAKNGWIVSAGAHQTATLDMETGQYRETTLRDLIDYIKLGDALDTSGSAPVKPLDQPVYLQEILMHKVAYEHSRYRINDLFEHNPKPTPTCARYCYEMAQAASKWFALGVWVISPRTFDAKELEMIYQFLDTGVPIWVASMPVAGVSAPITILGTIEQSMFEHFAALTMISLINTKSSCYISPNDAFDSDCFDMRYSTFVYGSVEYTLATLYELAICKRYGIPKVAKSLLTSAKEPDAHAAFEMGAHTLMAALAGARAFRCSGLISTGEVYSPEQLIINHEMIEYVKNLLQPQEFSEERLMVDEIKAVGRGQSFIGRMSTIKNFRKEYWEPTIFTHSNLGQWIEMGSKSVRDMAKERAQKLIREHEYMAADDVRKELDKIFQRAKTDEKLREEYGCL